MTTLARDGPARLAAPAIRYRQATADDLEACSEIWRAGIDDYLGRLNQPPMPVDLTALRALFGHFLATDPERFWLATREAVAAPAGHTMPLDADGRLRIGFGSATVRERQWFLGMLFVQPGEQAAGIGTELLDRTLTGTPGRPVTGSAGWTFGTCTDSAQPISNALYARVGLTPRVPIWRLAGELRRDVVARLPAGFSSEPFADALDGRPEAAARLADTVAAVDRASLGAAHPLDHEMLRRDGREGTLVRDPAGRAIGYGYASGSGRLGPIAALDPALLAPIVGHVATTIVTHDERSIWLPTIAGETLTMLLGAGLRLDGFPGILCWSEAATPFDRYVPISLALL